ncbi:MAG: hypothetical protein HYW26_03370 [Candidatus Aenigmarchaeota archaeon]|nr:hypothetical protein [Candidatus Aenigmarchaeota archaeon]
MKGIYHHLPDPRIIEEIAELNKNKSIENPDLFSPKSDRYKIERVVHNTLFDWNDERKLWLVKKSAGFDDIENYLHAYAIHRANNQLNEACNKLWPCLEFINAISKKISLETNYPRIGSKFQREFTAGTTIPNLYYSHLSSLLAIMSTFGFISIYLRPNRFYNLIRTPDGWKLYERKKYMKEICCKNTKGWHYQLIDLYEFLMNNLEGFPQTDLSKSIQLLDYRNQSQYDVLGGVSVSASMGFNLVFRYMPFIFNTLATAFRIIKKSHSITNYSDSRFEELCEKLPQLYENYYKEFPKNDYDLEI